MNALASPAASSLVRHQPVRAPVDDISAQHWQGGPIDCSVCQYAKLLALGEGLGCEPGYACMQDVYARRIDRFFRWHPTLSDQQLSHPYFEVRAIAARRASVFRLGALIHAPDETVRMQVAMRLPQSQLARLVNDPHREVRIRVAQRLAPADLAALRHDPDYGVRELVAQRLPLALLSVMAFDPDRAVRMHVAQRLEMPALMGMADDPDADVRRIVSECLPVALLSTLAHDPDWRVRWEVAQRADMATLESMLKDDEPEVRQAVRERLKSNVTPIGTHHG